VSAVLFACAKRKCAPYMGVLAAAGSVWAAGRDHMPHWAQRVLRVQWGHFLNGRAHRLGPFSTAGSRRLRPFVHYRSSHNHAKRDCGLYFLF